VRELQNIIERAMVLEPTGRSALAREVARVTPQDADGTKPPDPDARAVIGEDGFRSLERQNVVNALEQCGWRVAGPGGAAELLGLRPSTLEYRLKRLGIEKPR
jgi:transcriptional regulator with GAF, ATPase, and Fis domain